MKSAFTGVLLGNYPDLAFLEVLTVFKRAGLNTAWSRPLPHLALTTPPIDLTIFMQLGGSIKAGLVTAVSPSSLAAFITADLLSRQQTQFCLNQFTNQSDLKSLAHEIKQLLASHSLSGRFRLTKATATAGVGSTWADYLILVGPKVLVSVMITQAVQNLQWWSTKDYGRPSVNARPGLLPPKIARMLVNLALPEADLNYRRLLDPFCGSGTILQEALDLGCGQVDGSDVSLSQVKAATSNLTWFHGQINCPGQLLISQRDVMAYSSKLKLQPYDAIVFEGYLGPPTLPDSRIESELKGLGKFYLGVFKKMLPLLKPSGRLVAALPAYLTPGDNYRTVPVFIDTCEKLGYTLLVPPMLIGRPKARIKRQIIILCPKSNNPVKLASTPIVPVNA